MGFFFSTLRAIALIQNVISSVVMGIYMHRVLFGQLWIFAAYNPPSFNGNLVTHWIAVPMFVYLLSQASAIAFRPPGSVYMAVVGWLASIFPIAEIGAATFKLGMSPLQADAWTQWVWGELIDIVCIVISARLLQRSIFGDVQRASGHPML